MKTCMQCKYIKGKSVTHWCLQLMNFENACGNSEIDILVNMHPKLKLLLTTHENEFSLKI